MNNTTDLERNHLVGLKEESVADLKYVNSLEDEVDNLKSQMETQKTQFLNEIDRLSREYYYADHMNAILGIYTDLDEFTDLQCDYGETLEKCERLEKELSKIKQCQRILNLFKTCDYSWNLTKNQWLVPVRTTEPKHDVTNLLQHPLVVIVLFIVDTGASKHNTGNLKLLTNFVEKFLGNRFSWHRIVIPFLSRLNIPNPIMLIAKATSTQAVVTASSKDETPGVLIDFLTLVQRGLHAQVTTVRTDKGTEFLNKTLHAYFAKEGIRHETSTARTPEQNGVVERRNRTLVEAARTMLSAAKVPLFFWAEAIATACFTQNRSLVIPRHEKTPYHIINARKPSVKFFHIFGSLCYIVRDGENLDKMKEKGDACIFVGYSTQSKAYRVFNKRTRMIVETIHVNFDELPQMASDHVSSDPGPQCSTTVLDQDSLSPGPQSQENVSQAAETETTSNELELLYSPMFSELLNGTSPVVSKSSAVHAADNPDKRQQHNITHTSTTTDVADPPLLNIQSTHQTPTQVPTVTALEDINQAETVRY
ncbi:retrovirus-related pol polyprotein from transposon TNT 1-94 [Tanacetum coccineum]